MDNVDDKPLGPAVEIQVVMAEIRRVGVRPGDRFVLTYDGRLTMDQSRALTAYVQRQLQTEAVLVLEKGMRLEVMGEAVAGNGAH